MASRRALLAWRRRSRASGRRGARRGGRVLALFLDLIVAERLQDGFGGLLALGWPLVHRLAAVVVPAARAVVWCPLRRRRGAAVVRKPRRTDSGYRCQQSIALARRGCRTIAPNATAWRHKNTVPYRAVGKPRAHQLPDIALRRASTTSITRTHAADALTRRELFSLPAVCSLNTIAQRRARYGHQGIKITTRVHSAAIKRAA